MYGVVCVKQVGKRCKERTKILQVFDTSVAWDKQTSVPTTLILWTNIRSRTTPASFFHNKNKRNNFFWRFIHAIVFLTTKQRRPVLYVLVVLYGSKKCSQCNSLCTQTNMDASSNCRYIPGLIFQSAESGLYVKIGFSFFYSVFMRQRLDGGKIFTECECSGSEIA